jgi:acetyl-CoA acetyltransferase
LSRFPEIRLHHAALGRLRFGDTWVFVALLFEVVKRNARKGLATWCIGGGMGIAMCIARD